MLPDSVVCVVKTSVQVYILPVFARKLTELLEYPMRHGITYHQESSIGVDACNAQAATANFGGGGAW